MSKSLKYDVIISVVTGGYACLRATSNCPFKSTILAFRPEIVVFCSLYIPQAVHIMLTIKMATNRPSGIIHNNCIIVGSCCGRNCLTAKATIVMIRNAISAIRTGTGDALISQRPRKDQNCTPSMLQLYHTMYSGYMTLWDTYVN